MVTISSRGTPQLRRRKPNRSKLAIGQYALTLFLLAIFGSYVLFMMEMTKPPPPSKPTTPAVRPPDDDLHDTVWAEQAADEEKEHQDSVVVEEVEHHEPPGKWEDKVLRAYLEPIQREDWESKPLPNRTTAQSDKLNKVEYPKLNSCKRFMAQFPIDEFPDADPFLPWIHDVFPTHDGKFIQIVAQNKRRCRTGTTDEEKAILQHMAPQAAIFQHVAVKRRTISGETRYQLSSHEEADPDGMTTRFICRFKPTMEETLSVFNVNYDYAAWRKAHKKTFSPSGLDNKSIVTSQLLFQCPVPKQLQELIRTGATVENDFATQFLDIIPIRTPVRYGRSNQFFPPWYRDYQDKRDDPFNVAEEWGTHLIPRIEDSGRWENIPICAPSLQTFKPAKGDQVAIADNPKTHEPEKLHRLSICTWTSTGYHTRGERFQVSDGARRLREWVHFNLMVGVEHFYIYDNSGARDSESSLRPIADMFPDRITLVEWPAKVCNNNPNNVDSPGERSSQYAAEASCRLRFGPYTDWLGGYDVDEYISPMGEYNSLLPILDKLDKEGIKMINFRSWRAWPRRQVIEKPKPLEGRTICKSQHRCFALKVPENRTVIQTYNCDRQKGTKTRQMPAEKQIYRPDYVKLHFVHYSTVTTLSAANKSVYETMTSQRWKWPMTVDNAGRFSDEENEGTMLHSKAMATPDTAGWEDWCRNSSGLVCRIGNPYPAGYVDGDNVTIDEEGWTYNCYVNPKIESRYVPMLEEAMKSTQKQYDALQN
jgi:hypothetical protein